MHAATPNIATKAVTVECNGQCVSIVPLNRYRWQISDERDGVDEITLDDLPPQILKRFRLPNPIPYNQFSVALSGACVRGWIRNHTFPTHLWFLNLDIEEHPRVYSGASVHPSLQVALCAAIQSLRRDLWAMGLPPETYGHSQNEKADLGMFSFLNWEKLRRRDDAIGLCRSLATHISNRFRFAEDYCREAHDVIEALKGLGHRLEMVDSDGYVKRYRDFQQAPYSLSLAMWPPDGVRVVSSFEGVGVFGEATEGMAHSGVDDE